MGRRITIILVVVHSICQPGRVLQAQDLAERLVIITFAASLLVSVSDSSSLGTDHRRNPNLQIALQSPQRKAKKIVAISQNWLILYQAKFIFSRHVQKIDPPSCPDVMESGTS
ncbi:hypothetical protein RRG08_014744 [Elysia crispata]|uniref:Uncharacterized protein n=1 Tax=Elysia crispata TaxID=231223 RepID=A0AAE1ATY5_9GAST|nr:hypothetical protein RRG08_014744 [Elysia crispata]